MVVNYQHPIQCIRYVERQTAGSRNLFLASAGSKIYTYAAETGKQLAIWPEAANTADSTVVSVAPSSEGDEPSAKKRKVSPAPEQTAKRGQSETSTAWSTIPILAVSSDGNFVVAVTGEDKCLRVFEIEESGSLKQLSERHMPKRPSAIALVDDDKTILCGDKFGDVYSLPLIDTGKSSIAPKIHGKLKPNQPAATTLTVHSKRNLASLEQQLRHYGQKEKTADEKPTSAFELHLILGHVSMLTDLVYVSIPVDATSGRKRPYIFTADRDEHIRVSRGPPQAHIIENYCLGHTSFVSSLCVPQWAPEYLVSGGGDDYLIVWRWNEGRLVQKVPLLEEGTNSEVVVRRIWALSLNKGANSEEKANAIFVALDGFSKLLCFTLESDGSLKAQNSIQASGNVLDLTVPAGNSSIVVSVDAVREPGSAQEWRTTPSSPSTLLEAFRLKPSSEGLDWEPTSEAITAQINSEGISEISTDLEEKQKKELNDSLYSLGNLRKKNFGEDD
jgi:tRNA (guanine-N(7)-)-methyltransferase subunit TRM82